MKRRTEDPASWWRKPGILALSVLSLPIVLGQAAGDEPRLAAADPDSVWRAWEADPAVTITVSGVIHVDPMIGMGITFPDEPSWGVVDSGDATWWQLWGAEPSWPGVVRFDLSSEDEPGDTRGSTRPTSTGSRTEPPR